MSIKFQNFYGCSRSWNLLSSRANTLKIKSSQRGLVKPGSSGFQQLYHYLARDLPFHPSFALSHTARHFPVRERRFCGDSRIWPRFLRGKGGLLVISIQRFRIHPPESISNPSHHEQRYKIISFARSLYLGLICSIPLVEHLHLDHRWYS